MKVADIKSDKQFRSYNWKYLNIQTYGEHNDFPQALSEIITASKTGTACLDIYNDFVYGMDFVDESVGKIIVNSKRQTLNKFRQAITNDLTKYGGVAIHVNYNMLYKIRSMTVIPFENTRLGLENDKGYVTEIAVHDDWGRRDQNKYTWNPSKVVRYPVFNPDPDVIERQAASAGSWDEYKGQIFWWSREDGFTYPLPKYIAEMTDMRTEEGLANVTGRNVCSGLNAGGILVDIISDPEQNEKQVEEKQAELKKFMGDENSSSIWYGTAKNREELPEFIKFSSENYDKAFTATQAAVPDNIGQAFKQPPILRAKDVGANFGADLMTNAYKFYNSVTHRERQQVKEILKTLFEYWWVELNTPMFDIIPLVFNAGASVYDRLGKDAAAQIIRVIENKSLTLSQKRNVLKVTYGMTEDEALKLLPNTKAEGGSNAALIESIGIGGLQALLFLIQDKTVGIESKVNTLVIIFGLSESDARLIAESDININPEKIDDTQA